MISLSTFVTLMPIGFILFYKYCYFCDSCLCFYDICYIQASRYRINIVSRAGR